MRISIEIVIGDRLASAAGSVGQPSEFHEPMGIRSSKRLMRSDECEGISKAVGEMASGCESPYARGEQGTLGDASLSRGLPIPATHRHRLVDSCSSSAGIYLANLEAKVVYQMDSACLSP